MHFSDVQNPEPIDSLDGTDPLPAEDSPASKMKINRSSAVVGALALAALGGLWLMHQRSGPSTAVAADATQAQQTINTFLGNGEKNVASMQALLNNTEKVVEQFKQFPAAAQVPLEDLQKNPFSDADQIGRNSPADARQTERDAALEKAKKLQLQSILYGSSQRACMIGGRFHSEGDTFEGFTLEQVNPGSVIVKQGSFRFELKLQR